jgi:glycosyltransferase involved in cell wall biosynthesis
MDNKPSVLIITELFPNQEVTFLGSFVFSQLKALEDDYRIVVIVPVAFRVKIKQSLTRIGELDVYYIKSLASFFPMALCRFGFLEFDKAFYWRKKILARKIMGFSRKLHKKYHFSLIHGHEPYVGDEAAAIGRELGIPSVVTVHSFYEYHRRLFGCGVMPGIVQNLNDAGKLIAVSKIAADSYRSNGVTKDFEIIPNGIGDYETGAFPEPLNAKLKDKTVILSVGFFVAEKRVDQVIYAAIELRKKYKDSFAVLIIGAGPLENYYKEIVANNGMENQILILGQVPPSVIMFYYAAADFIVHPSVIDSFSMVCLEAMSAGKPFICTKNIGITEYITPGKEAFVVPPDNIGSLVEKMDLLMGNPELRKRMGRAARQTSLKFRWDSLKEKIVEIYERDRIR